MMIKKGNLFIDKYSHSIIKIKSTFTYKKDKYLSYSRFIKGKWVNQIVIIEDYVQEQYRRLTKIEKALYL